MTAPVMSRRALNRATLARQLLLERSTTHSPLDAVAHLVGLQAQVPHNPYLALWSRLDRFDAASLSRLLLDREVVRIVVMRATIHLVTADDCLTLRPLTQPVLDAELARHPEFSPVLDDTDLAAVLDFARPLLAAKPHSGPQLRAAMAAQFPDHPSPAALAYACRCLLPLVQVPPRGLWGKSAQVSSTTAEAWLGRPLAPDPSIDQVVLRYLAAFGPATPADVATWSRLTRFREVLDRLRSQLVTFRDDQGRELFDLPGAPRPDPDTPAPPRFLPEYDNVLLSHADRSRFAHDDSDRPVVATMAPVHGAVLSDGVLVGTWTRAKHVLTVNPIVDLTPEARDAIAAEGQAAVRFLTDGAETEAGIDVRFVVQ